MLDVLDAVLTLLEPGGAIDPATGLRTATSGTTVDHSGAAPYELEFAPNRLYGWVASDRHENWEAGDPPSVRERFALTLLFVIDSGDEQAQGRRLRSVSEALDYRAHAYMTLVEQNKAPKSDSALPWSELTGEITPDTTRGFNVRGVGLRLSGWRQPN